MKYAAILIALIASLAWTQASPSPTTAATVPITLDHNRIIIDVYFPLPDGTRTRVRGWVDTGDPDMSITEALAKKLGLTITGDGEQKRSTIPKQMLVGDVPLDLSAVKPPRLVSEESIAPGSSASVKIPATVLRHYDVVIDYFNREFTMDAPGSVHFEGSAAKANVSPDTGLIQLESMIAGEKHTISFDPGTSVSWISSELLSKWHKGHPQWPSMTGAVGPANLWGLPEEPTWQVLRIPGIDLGGIRLTNLIAVPFSKDVMDWYRKRAGVDTVGLVGAESLLNYRVGIDYAHSALYFKQLSKYTAPGIDVVGLTLRPEADGRYTVIGVAKYEGKPAVPDVQTGDVLLSVDHARVSGGTMGQAWSLLGGSPGSTRALTLERGGKQFTVQASVRRFLPAVVAKTR